MVAYDTYCFLKGEIKTFNTTVNGKITDTKEYRISEIDWVKFVANLLPLEALIFESVFHTDNIYGLTNVAVWGPVAIETVADALNWHPKTTVIHEINS